MRAVATIGIIQGRSEAPRMGAFSESPAASREEPALPTAVESDSAVGFGRLEVHTGYGRNAARVWADQAPRGLLIERYF